jgi:hypothetical protein
MHISELLNFIAGDPMLVVVTVFFVIALAVAGFCTFYLFRSR